MAWGGFYTTHGGRITRKDQEFNNFPISSVIRDGSIVQFRQNRIGRDRIVCSKLAAHWGSHPDTLSRMPTVSCSPGASWRSGC